MLVTKTPIAATMMEIITALVCLDTMAMAQFALVGFAIMRGTMYIGNLWCYLYLLQSRSIA